jgi:N-acetylmuramoyl-L-alanine amidase
MKLIRITFLLATFIFLILSLQGGRASASPLVALDAGHGGKDQGAVSPGGVQEKELNLDIAFRVQSLLANAGIRVLMTRTNDSFVGLEERGNMANQAGADIFVSIHNNYSLLADGNANPASTGTETYYFGGSLRGQLLASLIQQEIARRVGLTDRGIRTANFVVLAYTGMPAVLVEGAFLSNVLDEQLLRDANFRQSIAEGIFSGILKYFEETSEFQVFYPLPQYFLVHVPSITPSTRIQVSTYFTASKWVSQPILASGDYLIRVDPDGFVRSLDNKLAFTKSADGQSPSLTVYVLYPDNRNGADFTSYSWSTETNPQGAIRWASSGFVDFSSGGLSPSETGNSAALTTARETIYSEKIMLRVHLESVTPFSFLQIPFYWKNALFRSQKPLPAGDYWIQVMPDPNPANPASSPYLLSLDGKIPFRKYATGAKPDQIFAVFIAVPNRPEIGLDVLGFVHNFRRPNSLQPMLGARTTGPDAGLGFVSNTGVADPNRVSTAFPTIPTQTLTGGNYVVVSDAGLIRGRVMDRGAIKPLPGARITINGVSMFADANGEFSFTLMTPGTYTLEYSAAGFATQTQVINVAGGGPTYTPWAIMSP